MNILLPGGTAVFVERDGDMVMFPEPSESWLHTLYVAQVASPPSWSGLDDEVL